MTKLRVRHVNSEMLRQCREQIGLNFEEAQKKVKSLNKLENGELQPTFKQLASLSSLYHVPQWVFLKQELPEQYRFQESIPAFRQFSSSPIFDDHKVRAITANVARFRNLILEFSDDMQEKIPPFSPPDLTSDIVKLSRRIRKWLGCSETDSGKFQDWKKAVESKNIFVFMSSKYPGWSKIHPHLFRGISIYQETLPIIVINNSDAYQAQSFTLFHELGHLLKKESTLDEEFSPARSRSTEIWCNEFAGELLMPCSSFLQASKIFSLTGNKPEDLQQLAIIAKQFSVSKFACTMRMRNLKIINQQRYNEVELWLKEDYQQIKESRESRPLKRNMAKERLNQYGSIYSRVVVQAYREQEIGLHKFCKLMGIKKASDALKLESLV